MGFLALVCAVACGVSGCTSDETMELQGNNGNVGTLRYQWSAQTMSEDTVILVCNQILTYPDYSGNSRTAYPKAIVKLWPENNNTVEYTANTDPTPVYGSSHSTKGYEGISSTLYAIEQKITMKDGKVFHAKLSYDLLSYADNGRTLFYPHVELKELTFSEVVKLNKSGDLVRPELEFDVPWFTSNNTGDGKQKISISYVKKAVQEADVLLSTSFSKGLNWRDDAFQLYVEKKETWKLAGEKTTSISSPWLDFELNSSADASKEVQNFNFTGSPALTSSRPEDISQTGWKLKKSTTTQTLRFTNGVESFAHVFTYPLYEASITWEGQTFDFDLSVNFNETHSVTKFSDQSAKLTTVGSVVLDSKRIDRTTATSLSIPKTPEPDPDPYPYTGPKYGKILGFYVSTVFNPALLDNGRGALAEKCVMVHYETGYEWGICGYNEDFPSSFTYTASAYKEFNSVAKHSANDSYQLTYVQELTSSILWYDANNKLISGIDAVTCKIYGWPHIVDRKYASMFKTYGGNYSNNNYSLTITAPSGATRTFNSSPVN